MKAQSLSVVVPNPQCINTCKFCVSKMSANQYKNQMDDNLPFFDLYVKDYLKRLSFAKDNGCNTVMLTGDSEPQQNRKFLTYFGLFMQMMNDPFEWIEMQTTGILLDANYLRFLRNHVGVNVISLSISSLDDQENRNIIGFPSTVQHKICDLCAEIKKYDFTLRLSLNLSEAFGTYTPEDLFATCYELGADQITLRVLYAADGSTQPGDWVLKHQLQQSKVAELYRYITDFGVVIGKLPYGATKYSIEGMSVVLDDDCMGKKQVTAEAADTYKYLILRPDCKLYSSWDDPASLIF